MAEDGKVGDLSRWGKQMMACVRLIYGFHEAQCICFHVGLVMLTSVRKP
jgi:hypothetical protein